MVSDRHRAVRRLGKAVTRPLTGLPRGARRPWWKWLVIALLLGATVSVTAVYAITLATDIARQHWSSALDASREAVLVIVGWAAVFIVFSARDDRDLERAESGESAATLQAQDEPTAGAETVHQAQDHVRRLRVRFAELSAVRERAGSGADPDLDRELATTSARLEQARQWLTSAQSARRARGSHQHPDRRPDLRPEQRPDLRPDQRLAGKSRASVH
jgi:hypothetical protein